MTGKEWLIVVIVLAIVVGVGIPLIGSVLRSRDFKAQLSGKKEIRQPDEKQGGVPCETPGKQAELESEQYIAELKGKQNLLGPK